MEELEDGDRYAAGCFLFAMYSRDSFLDMQASGKISLDVHDAGDGTYGYLEASVERSRTSYSLERNARYLHVIAPIYGLCAEPWGIAWHSVLVKSEPTLGEGRPLLPGLCGEWGTLNFRLKVGPAGGDRSSTELGAKPDL